MKEWELACLGPAIKFSGFRPSSLVADVHSCLPDKKGHKAGAL